MTNAITFHPTYCNILLFKRKRNNSYEKRLKLTFFLIYATIKFLDNVMCNWICTISKAEEKPISVLVYLEKRQETA